MKGIALSASKDAKEKEEAGVLINQGLRYNLKSHVCWHVLGLYHRQERNYREAIKAYQCAMRIDKDNMQVLKDMSLLLLHLRHEDGNRAAYVDARTKIVMARAGVRANWISLAVAHHLNGDREQCLRTIAAWDKQAAAAAAAEKPPHPNSRAAAEVPEGQSKHERSEMVLYKARVLVEAGELERAWTLLTECDAVCVDRIGYHERRGALALRTQRTAEAEASYRALLEINPDQGDYHDGLRAALGWSSPSAAGQAATPEVQAKLEEFYAQFAKDAPQSASALRLPLDYATGALFERRLDAYLRKYMRKGVPNLFRDVQPLYADAAKAAVFDRLVAQYLEQLPAHRRFAPEDAPDAEGPSCVLWARLFAAQHYDAHHRDTARALAAINAAIAHTPTVVDLYLCKGRIYKHAGDAKKALQFFEQARSLDLADRYLNTKTVEYACAADENATAERLVQLFLRETDGERPLTLLVDMQAAWYECAQAESWLRQGQCGRALKQFLAVDKHFDDINEDQFDFHQYCMRKTTLRAYTDMLEWNDRLRAHPVYFRNAVGAARTYLRIHDDRAAAAARLVASSAAAAGGDDDDGKDGAAAASAASDEEKRRRQKVK